jgi:hypothetical protein
VAFDNGLDQLRHLRAKPDFPTLGANQSWDVLKLVDLFAPYWDRFAGEFFPLLPLVVLVEVLGEALLSRFVPAGDPVLNGVGWRAVGRD